MLAWAPFFDLKHMSFLNITYIYIYIHIEDKHELPAGLCHLLILSLPSGCPRLPKKTHLPGDETAIWLFGDIETSSLPFGLRFLREDDEFVGKPP